jgi:Putative DNA-binding domain
MQRTAHGGGRISAYAAQYIKPNERLTSFERLEIYNRQYWFRVLASMAEDFPGLRAILGQRRFEDMCRAYLAECRSRSFTLRNLGARLETWLRRNPKWTRGKRLSRWIWCVWSGRISKRSMVGPNRLSASKT